MTPREVIDRITAYLTGGGLFNPELANHDAVRDLLIDARDALSLAAAVDEAGEEAVQMCNEFADEFASIKRHSVAQAFRIAAALLVSQAEEIKRKDAEIAGLRQHAWLIFAAAHPKEGTP